MVRTGSALVAFMFIGTLAACGSPESQSATETPTQAAASAEQAAAAAPVAEMDKPMSGDTMNHSMADAPAATASPVGAKPSASPEGPAAPAKPEQKATPAPQPTPSATPTCAPEHRALGHC